MKIRRGRKKRERGERRGNDVEKRAVGQWREG